MKKYYGGVGWKSIQKSMFSTRVALKIMNESPCDVIINAGFNLNPHVNDRNEVETNIGYEIFKINPDIEKMKCELIKLGFKTRVENGVIYLQYPKEHQRLVKKAGKIFNANFLEQL
jgi:hypothetical protein